MNMVYTNLVVNSTIDNLHTPRHGNILCSGLAFKKVSMSIRHSHPKLLPSLVKRAYLLVQIIFTFSLLVPFLSFTERIHVGLVVGHLVLEGLRGREMWWMDEWMNGWVDG